MGCQNSIRTCRAHAASGPRARLAIRSTDPRAEAFDPVRDRQRVADSTPFPKFKTQASLLLVLSAVKTVDRFE